MDLVMLGGRVLTMAAGQPRAEAVAVNDRKIVAVGSTADVAPLIEADTEVVHLAGRAVIPGFVDPHTHFQITVFEPVAVDCRIPPLADKRAVLEEVRRILRVPGIFATYKYDYPKASGPAADVVEHHLVTHWEAHRSKRLTERDDTGDVMRDSGIFSEVTTATVPYVIRFDAPGFAGFLRSTSFVSAYVRTLEDEDRYVRKLTAELAAAQPGVIEVGLDIYMHIGKR